MPDQIEDMENTSKENTSKENTSNEIYIGKKPLMTYVTAALVQLANQPSVNIMARGMSITTAVDVAQIIVKRMDTLGYQVGNVGIGSELLKSQDGKERNVSTIKIEVSKQK